MTGLLLFDNGIPAVRGTTRTDERPTAHAKTLENAVHFLIFVPPPAVLPETGPLVAPTERECHLCGAAFGKAASVDPVRVHNETPPHGLRTRLWGCPGVESSRDPWYTPAQVLPDLTRTVPNLIRGASANVMRTKIANQYDWGNYRVYIRKQAKCPQHN